MSPTVVIASATVAAIATVTAVTVATTFIVMVVAVAISIVVATTTVVAVASTVIVVVTIVVVAIVAVIAVVAITAIITIIAVVSLVAIVVTFTAVLTATGIVAVIVAAFVLIFLLALTSTVTTISTLLRAGHLVATIRVGVVTLVVALVALVGALAGIPVRAFRRRFLGILRLGAGIRSPSRSLLRAGFPSWSGTSSRGTILNGLNQLMLAHGGDAANALAGSDFTQFCHSEGRKILWAACRGSGVRIGHGCPFIDLPCSHSLQGAMSLTLFRSYCPPPRVLRRRTFTTGGKYPQLAGNYRKSQAKGLDVETKPRHLAYIISASQTRASGLKIVRKF